MEKQILKFKLPLLNRLSFIELITFVGWRETGNKFTVQFNGSKGYLSHVEIFCEGYQKADNRIWIENLKTKSGHLKSVYVNVLWSEENGVRIVLGKIK